MIMHVFAHSHYQTGEPLCIDVFAIHGYCHMEWYRQAIEEVNQKELADYLFECGVPLDTPCWIIVDCLWEDASEPPEAYFEILSVYIN